MVEDDRRLAELIAERLRGAGHEAETADNGVDGLSLSLSGRFDVVIADVMLPGMDGIALTSTLRDRGRTVPILMLTARDAVGDRVDGLRSGADDYLVKPFAFDELLARLEALVRRGTDRSNGGVLTQGALTLDPAARRVAVDGAEVELTPTEYALLRCLLEHRGRVMTRQELKGLVWDFPFDAKTKVVDLYIHYLRQKLGPAGAEIETVRGVGYAIGR